jgi:hypothetical protein
MRLLFESFKLQHSDVPVGHYAVTLMVGLQGPNSPHSSVFLDLRDDGMNTAADFFDFVKVLA